MHIHKVCKGTLRNYIKTRAGSEVIDEQFQAEITDKHQGLCFLINMQLIKTLKNIVIALKIVQKYIWQ